MKKISVLCLVIFTSILSAVAGPVDSTTAKNLAREFWQMEFGTPRQAAAGLEFHNLSPQLGLNQLYVLQNAGGEGFVILSSDDRAIPVLGYSDHGTVNTADMPDNFRMWLQIYEEEIAAAVSHQLPQSEAVAAEWAALAVGERMTPRATTAVSPLLSTTWDQGSPYNSMCPGSGWNKCPTGCVATAMAQVMKYWSYPTKGCGSHSYVCSYNNQTLSADFGNTTYSWSSMPNSVTSSNTAVATLMFHCGVAVEMNYSASGSGAPMLDPYGSNYPSAETALKYNFGYTSTLNGKYKDDYTTNEWIAFLKTELDAGRPVLYSGFDDTYSDGHAFVCDGYNNSDYFHFNWGWSGSNDGYFAVTSLNPGSGGWGSSHYDFTYVQQALFGVEPPVLVLNSSYSLTPNSTTIQHGSRPTFGINYKNRTNNAFTGQIRLVLLNENGYLAQVIGESSNVTVNGGSVASLSFAEVITVVPGNYKLVLQYKTNSSDTWTFVGIGSASNLLDVTVVLDPDNYEDNNTGNTAYLFTPNFTNNQATINTTGSNFHVGDSYDYYRINLPSGYRYTVNVRAQDAADCDNNQYYTSDVTFRISQNGGSWGTNIDTIAPTFVLEDGGPILYKVQPKGSGIGTYMIATQITRTPNTGIDDEAAAAISVFPNPCNNTLQVQCLLYNAQLLLYDMYGKMVLSVPADGEVTSLDMSQLSAGLYLLNVSKDNSVVKSVKVVRQ
jgi:hypothetical protein